MKINPYVKLIVLIVCLIILYVSKTAVIASLIGVGIGVLVSPVLDYLQKWLKIRRSLCLLFLLTLSLIVAVVMGVSLGWVIFEQGSLLSMEMPRFSAQLRMQLENTFDRFPWMLEQI